MNTNSKLVPKRRFKEFINANAWEQRKLIEMLIQPITDGPHETPELVDEGIPFISVDAIVDNRIEFSRRRGFITEKYHEQCCKKYNPQFNDVYLVKSGSTVGKTAIVETYDRFNIWSPLAAMRCGDRSDPYFLYHMIQTKQLQTQVFDKCSHGTQPNLSMRQLEKFDVNVPNIEEQNKIGQYFTYLDNLITLYQRKLEKLKSMKAAYLTEMFPQEGESVPKRRFAGFTDAWEQRKVSEITKFHKQGYYTKEDYGDNKKYFLLRGTDLSENKLVLKDTPRIDATEKDYAVFKTEIGDFLIVRSGTVGTYGIVDVEFPAIFGSYLINFRFDMEQVTNEFFGYFYQTNLFKTQLSKIVQQSANTNINAENIKSIAISLPPLVEQKKIAEYLGNLDNLITLHQRKLEKLQNIKKAYLNEVFV
ncbi:MAG: restriction endonuclease subunit S [Candidatus Pacebacteria bacterium]|nr:restriction endonuclease subunit S [Candidatus Paceibacterota bacterium]